MPYAIKFVRNNSMPSVTLTNIISLKYEKERYTPYTKLSARVWADGAFDDINQIVLFSRSGKLLHQGTADYAEIEAVNGRWIITVSSRGYSCALGMNQLTPGMYSNVTIENLLKSDIVLPHVYYEQMSDSIGYVYVKENDSMWDSAAAFARKHSGNYPYISGANTVRITRDSSLASIGVNTDKIISIAAGQDKSRVVSHYHMKDLEGTYNTYNLADSAAVNQEMIRHKHISFDRQWLSEPQEAMRYRMDFAARGLNYVKVKYLGSMDEELRQIASAQYGGIAVTGREISRIILELKNGTEYTTLWFYKDCYTA